MPCWACDMSFRPLPYHPGGNPGLESRTVEGKRLDFLISQSVCSLSNWCQALHREQKELVAVLREPE